MYAESIALGIFGLEEGSEQNITKTTYTVYYLSKFFSKLNIFKRLHCTASHAYNITWSRVEEMHVSFIKGFIIRVQSKIQNAQKN